MVVEVEVEAHTHTSWSCKLSCRCFQAAVAANSDCCFLRLYFYLQKQPFFQTNLEKGSCFTAAQQSMSKIKKLSLLNISLALSG